MPVSENVISPPKTETPANYKLERELYDITVLRKDDILI